MGDATISRARLRDLACLGRARPAETGAAGLRRTSASHRRAGTDAASIATVPVAVRQSCQLAPRVGRAHGITHLAAGSTLAPSDEVLEHDPEPERKRQPDQDAEEGPPEELVAPHG